MPVASLLTETRAPPLIGLLPSRTAKEDIQRRSWFWTVKEVMWAPKRERVRVEVRVESVIESLGPLGSGFCMVGVGGKGGGREEDTSGRGKSIKYYLRKRSTVNCWLLNRRLFFSAGFYAVVYGGVLNENIFG